MAGTSHKTILLVGNPNVGKSVLFNYLTGKYAQISNYPGTTVSISKGEASIGGEKVTVIDTPGVNSLFPMSEDEVVTRDILLQTEGGIVIQVADAKNLQRALALTLQLSEMNVPMILVVNMCDEADRANIEIDFVKLEKELGIPVLPTVAVRQKGVAAIREKLSQAKLLARKPAYCAAFENSLRDIGEALPSTQYRRAMATMLLAGDKRIAEKFFPGIAKEKREQIETICRRLSGQFAQPINFLMSQERQAQAKQILKKVVTQGFQRKAFSEWLGRLTIHPFWGIVTLMGVLWGVYKFVGEFGAGTLVDWIENGIFGKYVSPAAIALFDKLIPRDANLVFRLIHDCFVGEYGLITMGISYGFAIVLPIVATFFIAFSIMEDSGYLPRLAIMVNRIFKLIGLNGKAILPMVLGLGCDTMATLTTRILETRKQRLIVTLLLALSVPCSAQLGILLGMFGQMPAWTFIVWLSIILGSLFTVGFASNLLIKGDACAFVMEIPPLRLPQAKNVIKKTVTRMEWYVKEAIPLFLLGTFVLYLLDALHLLQWIQKGMAPIVVNFLGLPVEAANAFLIGFLRRDYGATGFFDMFQHGRLSVVQGLVALTVITLFIPCVANIFMIIKEYGNKVALRVVFFIFPFAFLVGGILHWALK